MSNQSRNPQKIFRASVIEPLSGIVLFLICSILSVTKMLDNPSLNDFYIAFLLFALAVTSLILGVNTPLKAEFRGRRDWS